MSIPTVVDRNTSIELGRRHGSEPTVLGRVLVLGLCSLLIFAVLAFGAVDEWSTFGLESGSAILFLMWAAQQTWSGQLKLSKNPLYPPTFLFFGLILAQIALRTSAYSYATRYETLQYIGYGIILFIASECVREKDYRRLFVLVMSVFGGVYALFSLVQMLTSNGRIFWIHSPRSASGMIFGSYVNHNHYAGLMEMLTPIPFVLGMGQLLRGGQRALAGFCAGLMATTIFLSGSRGGMIAFVFEAVLFGALAFGRKRRPRMAWGAMAICILILGLLLFVDKGRSLSRLGDLGPGIRLIIIKDSLRMFAHRPLLGWGLGTFPTVYPSYRSFYTNLFVNEAHNDYAQVLVETGLLGFALMVWFLVCLYRSGLRSVRRWEVKWDAALSFAALLGCTGMLFHSFVDFNLQIPANAAVFYALCALAASEIPLQSSQVRRARTTESGEIREPSGID